MAIQGREPRNRFSTNVVHGTRVKDAMGNETATEPTAYTTDARTGEVTTRGIGEKPKSNAVSAGQVVNGFRFKGGDPSKQTSWEKA